MKERRRKGIRGRTKERGQGRKEGYKRKTVRKEKE
jgi:hypothetical protein